MLSLRTSVRKSIVTVCAMFCIGAPALADVDAINPYDNYNDRPEALCKLGQNVEYTKWSGQHSGTITELSRPSSDWHAVRNIANYESYNDACLTQVQLMRMPGAMDETRIFLAEHDICRGMARDDIYVGNVSQSGEIGGHAYESLENLYVTGVQICNNNHSDVSKRTMKGLKVRTKFIEGSVINEGNGLETRTCNMRNWTDDDERTIFVQNINNAYSVTLNDRVEKDTRFSCRNWGQMRECPDGFVATGVQLNDNDAGTSGIRLQCREVIESWVMPPAPEPPTTVAPTITGP